MKNELMPESLSRLKLTPDEPFNHQITAGVRQLIRRRELPPGTRLPTLHQLAAAWKTNYFTVQSALTPLVREGLLERRRRHGTVVRRPRHELSSAGIYFGGSILNSPNSAFSQAVYEALQSRLTAAGVTCRTWIDTRSDADQMEPLPELAADVAAGRIQALLIPSCNQRVLTWLTRLPVPQTIISSVLSGNAVGFDPTDFARKGIAALAERGCRSVALITHMPLAVNAGKSKQKNLAQLPFLELAAAAGLTVRPEWMSSNKVSSDDFEATGYRRFKEIWSLPQRPDGLLVFPDIMARGVIAAILELQVRVPQELRVAMHKNDGVLLFTPFPAVFLVSSPGEAAEAMLGQVNRQLANEPVSPVILHYRVVENQLPGK